MTDTALDYQTLTTADTSGLDDLFAAPQSTGQVIDIRQDHRPQVIDIAIDSPVQDSLGQDTDEAQDNQSSGWTIGGTPVSIMLYFDDVDAMCNQAVAAGATVERAVENQFYGDRSGGLRDPFGHRDCAEA
ncbi:MAG: hypothetical protein JST01_14680 [Cyanobacteria bacterium SZAS TMP-1]|nr:hypothetical protein [Cyanobacteria bacterium SZAS TMP-1]